MNTSTTTKAPRYVQGHCPACIAAEAASDAGARSHVQLELVRLCMCGGCNAETIHELEAAVLDQDAEAASKAIARRRRHAA